MDLLEPTRQAFALLFTGDAKLWGIIWISLWVALAAIALIADLGLAGFADLARAVGLGVEELAAIWDRLPLGDLEIGERLGIPRQQVINLRSSARQRLERRFKPD